MCLFRFLESGIVMTRKNANECENECENSHSFAFWSSQLKTAETPTFAYLAHSRSPSILVGLCQTWLNSTSSLSAAESLASHLPSPFQRPSQLRQTSPSLNSGINLEILAVL